MWNRGFRWNALVLALVIMGLTTLSPSADAQALGPTPYLCFDTGTIAGCGSADSPFKSVDFSGGYFHLEDFEDGALGGVDAPGVTSANVVNGTISGINSVDSVDEDDGLIDGSGAGGTSWAYGVDTFSFDEGVLGSLPTHVGIVATDTNAPVIIDFFGPGMVLLGSIGPIDLGFTSVAESETSKDRFFGWMDNGGIEAIRVEGGPPSGPGVSSHAEWDHLQYGAIAEPSPVPIMSIGGLLALTSLLGVVGLRRLKRP